MIRLLLDANLSWRSAGGLKEHFEDCLHADSIGIAVPAKDSEIWNYAKRNNLLIVTNDEDFAAIQLLQGFPPKLIWLKIGNQPRKYIENLLIKMKDEIAMFYQSAEYGLLEIL
jgi:predicted nuclease of predicted toxin-antitoxin system